jgi:predicted DNA-binding transcriptional regulator AlpA
MGGDASRTDAALAVDARRLGKTLGLSLRTIRTMDAAGKLPRPVKLNGHSVRWVLSEVESWLAAGAPDRQSWEAMRKDGATKRT